MPFAKVHDSDVEYFQTGSGPDLLLLHSLLTDASVFETLAPLLTRSWRVTCINLPGFGASAPVALDTVGDYADHVAEAMRVIGLASTCALFGNGFGAFVALETAIRHGASLGRLMVADVVPAFPEPARAPFRMMAAKVRESGMGAVLETAIGRMFPAEFQQKEPGLVAQRKERLAKVDPECFARACLGLAQLDLTPRLPSIRNATLVMCGALDQTTPPALARQVAEAIPGARYEEIAGSGHCPMLEQPRTLADMMRRFAAA